MQPVSPTSRTKGPRKNRFWGTIKALTRARVITGLITILPIYITVLVVQFVFRLLRDSSQWVVYGILEHDWRPWGLEWGGFTEGQLNTPAMQWGLAIFSVLLTGFILYAVGVATANILGRRFLRAVELLIDRVPLAKSVYHASKQILESFASPTPSTFQRVVLVPFPSREVKSIAFVTSTSVDPNTGQELVSVFLATTPNPTTGYVFLTPRAEITELDWSVEVAVKAVMSGGILTPGSVTWTPPGAARTETSSGPEAPPPVP